VKVLRAAFQVLAAKLQEAADLTSSDVASRLRDELGDMHRGTGHYANYHDHMGDGKSGDVVYSVDGNTVKAPYEISGKDGEAAKTFIHADKAQNVVPRTVYEPEADQDELDQYAMMTEAGLYTKTAIATACIPLVERMIAKSERDAADSSDFAGKGKSFPILKAEDVDAAFQSLGRAGSGNYSTDVIRKNIIKIAKRKGFPLPKSAQDDSASATESLREADAAKCPKCNGLGKRGSKDCPKCDGTGKMQEAAKAKKMTCKACDGSGDCPQCDGDGTDENDADCMACDGDGDCPCCDGDGSIAATAASESQRGGAVSGLRLVESVPFPVDIQLREAFTPGKKIKLISPGPGSSAYYTKEALQQAARDKIFHAGLPMRIDHPTKADEAARPEGSVKDWGAVLATDAAWLDAYESAGKDQGPGLYSDIKPFSDHAKTIDEKGPFAGVSICAYGDAQVSESGGVVRRNGLPVIERFTKADGADMVTRAGAGGMFLAEAARGKTQRREARHQSNKGDEGMTLQEAQRLIEQAVAPLRSRTIKQDAREEGARLLETAALPDVTKQRIIDRVCESLPMAGNELDETKFREAVVREAKAEGQYLAQITGGGNVFGMGMHQEAAPDPEKVKKLQEAERLQESRDEAVFNELMGNPIAAKLAVKGRAA
jgi:hypothetical protein